MARIRSLHPCDFCSLTSELYEFTLDNVTNLMYYSAELAPQQGVSLSTMDCAFQCTHQPECFAFLFLDAGNNCTLVLLSLEPNFLNFHVFANWTFYLQNLSSGEDPMTDVRPTTGAPVSSTSAAICDHMYAPRSGLCINFQNVYLTWTEADTNCKSLGGNLVTFDNIDQFNEFRMFVLSSEYEGFDYYVGLHAEGSSLVWVWADDTGNSFDLTNAGHWGHVSTAEMSCAIMDDAQEYYIESIPCSTVYRSICEF